MSFTPASMPKKTVPKRPHVSRALIASKKAAPAVNVTDCAHVIKGAVWCVDCATNFRTRSRELYTMALGSANHKPEVIQAAHTRLKKSLTEYSLTTAGIEELQREYVNLVASGDHRAQNIYDLSKQKAKEASDRNLKAKEDLNKRAAQMSTFESRVIQYVVPNRNVHGLVDLKGISLGMTTHARERMELRDILHNEITAVFLGDNIITPEGNGLWQITDKTGKSDLVICGFFERVIRVERFVVTTVYRKHETSEDNENTVEN